MKKTTLSICAAGLLFVHGAAFGATISVEPVLQNVPVGRTFSVNISVVDVSDLYAFQFDLGFNPLVVNAMQVSEGPFLLSGGPTFFLPGTIDNVFGTITFNANSLLGPGSGVSGSGLLMTAQFSAIGSGGSTISIGNLLALDSLGDSIAFTSTAGNVTVPTPEPSFGVLWSSVVLVWLLASRRRFRQKRG